MTTIIEAAQQTLEALENAIHPWETEAAITALRQAIEQAQKQEPVAHIPTDALEQLKTPTLILRNVPIYGYSADGTVAVFTTPPPRQPLTDGLTEIIRSFGYTTWGQSIEIAEAIKAAHGIKGGA